LSDMKTSPTSKRLRVSSATSIGPRIFLIFQHCPLDSHPLSNLAATQLVSVVGAAGLLNTLCPSRTLAMSGRGLVTLTIYNAKASCPSLANVDSSVIEGKGRHYSHLIETVALTATYSFNYYQNAQPSSSTATTTMQVEIAAAEYDHNGPDQVASHCPEWCDKRLAELLQMREPDFS